MNKQHCIILNSNIILRVAGPYRMATFLQEHNWDCDIVDYFEHWRHDLLKKYLTRKITPDTKWVGISYTWMSLRYKRVIEIVKLIKSINPELLVIIGGQTPYYHDLGADYYIYGYAEHATLKVLDYEFGDGVLPFYNKLFGGKYIDASKNYPSYDLKDYSIRYKDSDFISNKDVLSIAFSRGCKFKCDFCTFPFIGIKEDTSSSEELLYQELMENYQKWGTINYTITDETLNDRTDKLIKIKNVIQRLDFKPNLNGFVRADLLKSHPEHIELLAEARVWGHLYGVETFNREAGKSIGKGQNPDIIKENLLKMREYFQKHLGLYRGTISMIAGLPYESLDSLRESQKWFIENWSDQGVSWHALRIVSTTDDKGSLSTMGKDFSKYGYRKIEGHDEIIKTKVGMSTDKIYWENDYTNFFEVEKMIDEEFNFKFKMNGFSMWPLIPFIPLNKLLEMEHRYIIDTEESRPLKQHIANYINLKYQS